MKFKKFLKRVFKANTRKYCSNAVCLYVKGVEFHVQYSHLSRYVCISILWFSFMVFVFVFLFFFSFFSFVFPFNRVLKCWKCDTFAYVISFENFQLNAAAMRVENYLTFCFHVVVVIKPITRLRWNLLLAQMIDICWLLFKNNSFFLYCL